MGSHVTAVQSLQGRHTWLPSLLEPPVGWLSHLLPPWMSTGQSESVRDVQFSIRDYFTFASTFENGNVQLWDIRRPDRCERMFTAHNGPVFCCDWHPEDRCGEGWGGVGRKGCLRTCEAESGEPSHPRRGC